MPAFIAAKVRPFRIPSFASTLEVPRRLRVMMRARETNLVLLAAIAGALAGLVVTAMGAGVDLLHTALFGIKDGERLSAHTSLDPKYAFSVPFFGGLLFGVVSALIARRRGGREVDPIEANALHGGRMSLTGSLFVALQTVWSSGVGASVGLEAGYTQLASGLASKLGGAFRLRRGDLRILVGCGAAGAIAGAFGAPLSGAFYAFELVIASYAVQSLAPVGTAAVIGFLVARAIGPTPLGLLTTGVEVMSSRDLAIAAGLGVLAAGFGITLMRGVALCEAAFARLRVLPAFRPGFGGLLVGLMALVSPQIMSSGHGALHVAGMLDRPLKEIALLFLLKAAASAVSLGSRFRGGLFFASLLLGALGGHLFAAALNIVWPTLVLDPNVYAVIGMGALSASVIGGPLTMTFIALEMTGNLWLTAAVLIAVIISAQITRETFGYSFATWRFHLRGETIRSAADVGWIRDLTVERMMRRDVPSVRSDMPVSEFRAQFPLSSATRVVAIDADDRYAGLVIVAEAHGDELDVTSPVAAILRHQDDVLLPTMTIREAVVTFDQTEAEALAVVDGRDSGRVMGVLTEAYVLRRYSAALESRRRDWQGDI